MFLKNKKIEKILQALLFISTGLTVVFLFVILAYVFLKGFQGISLDFFLQAPKNMGSEGGIFPVIIGTFYFLLLTILISSPLSIGTAIYLEEYSQKSFLVDVFRFSIDLLAAIPSIIFGLFGYAFFVIFLGKYTGGWSLISGSLTAVCMIIPIMTKTAEESLKRVPNYLKEASYALGASKWQTIKNVVLPVAFPGIVTGLILGIGRAIGETAALLLTLGGTLLLPFSIFDGTRTLSMHLYLVAMETGNLEMAFSTALVLIVFIVILNFILKALSKGWTVKDL